MVRLYVFKSGSEFSTVYPMRKLADNGSGVVDYFAQSRENDTTALAARCAKGLKIAALTFVALPSPAPIGKAPGATDDAAHVGYLTDDAAGLSAELASAKRK